MALPLRLVDSRNWRPYAPRWADFDFDDLLRRSFGRQAGFVPAANVTQDGSDLTVAFELPGVTADDVQVEVTEGKLVISGQRAEDTSREDESAVLVREIRTGSFRRSFALPRGVTSDQVEAHYDRGVLRVRVRDAFRSDSTKVEVQDLGTESPSEN